MNEIKRFLSRKFLLTLLASAFAVFSALSGFAGEIGTLCSVAAAFIVPVSYVVTEGRIDAKALEMLSESSKKASEVLKETGEK